MKRKIVLHGPSTLTVSLPSKWAQKFKLKKGDELGVEEIGNELRIIAGETRVLEKKKVDVGGLDRVAKATVAASYRQGYDEVIIDFDDAEFLHKLSDLVSREMMGFEIVKQSKNQCVIKDLVGNNKYEFDVALRRMWLLVLDMVSEMEDCFRRRDFDKLGLVPAMDSPINKMNNYCARLLVKRGHSSFNKTSLYYHFVESLEELADRYKDLCHLYLEGKEKIDEDFINDFARVKTHLSDFYSVFYSYDDEKVETLLGEIKLTYNGLFNSKKRMDIYLSSVCKDITDLLGTLSEIALN